MPKRLNDGGPAFPRGVFPDDWNKRAGEPVYPGLNLRDWFAGQALVGLVAARRIPYAYTHDRRATFG